jgi:hypothetical protein
MGKVLRSSDLTSLVQFTSFWSQFLSHFFVLLSQLSPYRMYVSGFRVWWAFLKVGFEGRKILKFF